MNSTQRVVGNLVGLGVIGVLLLVSLFSGLMVATAGGALYPPIAVAGAPWACKGEIEVQSRRYSYKPGQQGVTRNFYCREGGTKEDITMRVIVHSFLLYSGAIFVFWLCIAIPGLWVLRQKTAGWGERFEQARAKWKAQANEGQHIVVNLSQQSSDDIEQRLRRLQQLLDQGLITRQDYETKKAELLSQL